MVLCQRVVDIVEKLDRHKMEIEQRKQKQKSWLEKKNFSRYNDPVLSSYNCNAYHFPLYPCQLFFIISVSIK